VDELERGVSELYGKPDVIEKIVKSCESYSGLDRYSNGEFDAKADTSVMDNKELRRWLLQAICRGWAPSKLAEHMKMPGEEVPGFIRRMLGPRILARLAKLQRAETELTRMMIKPKIMMELERVVTNGSSKDKLEAAKLIMNEQKSDITINNGVQVMVEPSAEMKERYGKRLDELLAKTLERNPRTRKVSSIVVDHGNPTSGD
jgi:hypothetical protein